MPDFPVSARSSHRWSRAEPAIRRYSIAEPSLTAAKDAGLVVITTAGAYDQDREDNSAAQEAVDKNLELLKGAGVPS